MRYTIEKLMFSDEPVQGYFITARDKWKQIFSEVKDRGIDEIADRVWKEQRSFERECGGRWPGQEVMAWSAFGYLYNSERGFDENRSLAEIIAQAFKASGCSLEVKSHAEQAAKLYGIEPEN